MKIQMSVRNQKTVFGVFNDDEILVSEWFRSEQVAQDWITANAQPLTITTETPAEFLERELQAAQAECEFDYAIANYNPSGNTWADLEADGHNTFTIIIHGHNNNSIEAIAKKDIHGATNIRTQARLLTIAAAIAERWEARQQEAE